MGSRKIYLFLFFLSTQGKKGFYNDKGGILCSLLLPGPIFDQDYYRCHYRESGYGSAVCHPKFLPTHKSHLYC
jgi:hypothetical protein